MSKHRGTNHETAKSKLCRRSEGGVYKIQGCTKPSQVFREIGEHQNPKCRLSREPQLVVNLNMNHSDHSGMSGERILLS